MCYTNSIVGVDCDEVPPVPIPNTEVKLIGAEDTWLEAARENRLMPTPAVAILRTYSSLAQSVEHAAVNRSVVGSSPTGGVLGNEQLKLIFGSMVKRLRHRPFTAVTGVQIPLESFK